MTDATLALGYAARPRWHGRPGLRAVVFVPTLLVAVLLGSTFTPRAWRHAEMLLNRRRCQADSVPPSVVVFDNTVRPEEQVLWRSGAPFPFGTTPSISRRLPAWDALRPPPAVAGMPVWSAAFLHSRTAGDYAPERLVAVEVEIEQGCTQHHHMLKATVMQTGGPLSKPTVVGPAAGVVRRSRDEGSIALEGDWHIEIFAGQPDPHDSARFTIRYRAYEYTGDYFEGIIEGRLRPDDVVVFRHCGKPRYVAAAAQRDDGTR